MSFQEIDGNPDYRQRLAGSIKSCRFYESRSAAIEMLNAARISIPYQVAQALHRQPEILAVIPADSKPIPLRGGGETDNFKYYRSNEFYLGLSEELHDLGGVGLAVGADQGLDFYNMANLDEVYNIDIDPNTHLITRTYLEAGTRLHKLLGRYPTTDELINLYRPDHWDVTYDMLSAPSNGHTFSKSELYWVYNYYDAASGHNLNHTRDYLKAKRKHYGKDSWIGTDEALKHTIEGYEQGKIHIYTGDICGGLIYSIANHTRNQDQQVTLIYASNAPIESSESIQRFRNLPLSSSAIVVSSANPNPEFQIEAIQNPDGFKGLLRWSMLVFSPLEFDDWPDASDDEVKSIQISQGSYRLTK